MNYEFHVGDYVETVDGWIGKEKKKIKQLEKDLPIEMKVGDKVATMKQYFDGNCSTIIYSTKMIDKINELVDVVNELMDKEDDR